MRDIKSIFVAVLGVVTSLNLFAQTEMTDAFYIIKDGVVQPGVSIDSTSYCPLEVTQYDGYLSIKKKGLYYQYLYFNLDAERELQLQDKDLVVEYMLPTTALCDINHWENRYKNICAEKNAPTMTVSAIDENGRTTSRVYIDGKFDENSAKDFVTYQGYSYPKYKEEVKIIKLSYIERWAWYESEDEPLPDSLKVKNLYYAKRKDSPHRFFASQFDGLNSWTELQAVCANYHGASVESNNEDDYLPRLKMLYMNERGNWTCSDGSGYLSSELLHGLLVKNAALCKFDGVTPTDTLFIRPITLPKGARNIDFEAIVRVDKRVKEGAKRENLPIYVKFNNQKQMTRLFNDTIPNIYTKVKASKVVPAGAKSFSLVFLQAPTATFVVDNLIISTKDPLVATKPQGVSSTKSGAQVPKK